MRKWPHKVCQNNKFIILKLSGELALLPTQIFQEINVALNVNILRTLRLFQTQFSSSGGILSPNPNMTSPQTPKTPGGTMSTTTTTASMANATPNFWGANSATIMSPPDFLRGINTMPSNDFL